jgi:hypothetical protein
MEFNLEQDRRTGGPPQFLADTMLGRLATWLRVLGYDAEYARDEDAALIERARATGRILLTRDTGIVRRRKLPAHLFVRSDHITEQLIQVIRAFQLTSTDPAARRCPRCNVPIEPRTKAEVFDRVPEFVRSTQDAFWGCSVCGRVYWAGSHWRRMNETIRTLMAYGAAMRSRNHVRGSQTWLTNGTEMTTS